MTKREYAEEIAVRVNGNVKEVEKANGVVFTGITWNGASVSPCIYIDRYYENNFPIDDAVEDVLCVKKQNSNVKIDLTVLDSYEYVRPYLSARLYNQSTKADIYISAGKYGFKDLIIVPVVEFPQINGSTKVNKKLLAKWGVSLQTVIEDCLSSIDVTITSLMKIMSDIMEIPYDEEMEGQFPAYVVTNESKYFGAISVIKAKEELHKMFPEGYTILPSSVHEVIIVGGHDDELTEIVKAVNAKQVLPEERLSDKVYQF